MSDFDNASSGRFGDDNQMNRGMGRNDDLLYTGRTNDVNNNTKNLGSEDPMGRRRDMNKNNDPENSTGRGGFDNMGRGDFDTMGSSGLDNNNNTRREVFGHNVTGIGSNDGFNGDSNFASSTKGGFDSSRRGDDTSGLRDDTQGLDQGPTLHSGGTTRHGVGNTGGFDDSTSRNMGSGVAGGYEGNDSNRMNQRDDRFDEGLGRDNMGDNSGLGGRNADTYGSGAKDDWNDPNKKPNMGEKIKGTAEQMVGKMTKNPEKVDEGRQLRSGNKTSNA